MHPRTPYLREQRRRYKELGLCYRCPSPILAGHSLCPIHLEKQRKSSNERNRQLKIECFNYYGHQCTCCKEPELEFLTIDHIEGGGNKHRKEIFGNHTRAGSYMYNWLKLNKYPEGFQVLCMNCNFAKGHFGICPHKREKEHEGNKV